MLPTRLLAYRRTNGAAVPTWLMARDEVWLRELAAEAAASEGRRVDVAEERIQELVVPLARRHGVARRVVEAVWLVERRRWKTKIDAPIAPERIRRVVFDLAAERSRDEALATAAHELGVAIDAIELSLFADRARARRLVAPDVPCSAAALAASFNLALVQSLLCRATEIVALVRGNSRAIVRYANLLGLMTSIDETDDGTTRIRVSGALALFHDTLKYGRALARWFPSIVSTPGWSVEGRILLAGEPLRLNLDGSAPLPRAHALPRAHDSRIEALLENDLRRLGSAWRIERESTVIRAGARIFYPDFTLVSERGRVLVEVVGFWTPEYLAEKAALLAACPVPLVVCADAAARFARCACRRMPSTACKSSCSDRDSLLERTSAPAATTACSSTASCPSRAEPRTMCTSTNASSFSSIGRRPRASASTRLVSSSSRSASSA